jgi:hypothetical protein
MRPPHARATVPANLRKRFRVSAFTAGRRVFAAGATLTRNGDSAARILQGFAPDMFFVIPEETDYVSNFRTPNFADRVYVGLLRRRRRLLF